MEDLAYSMQKKNRHPILRIDFLFTVLFFNCICLTIELTHFTLSQTVLGVFAVVYLLTLAVMEYSMQGVGIFDDTKKEYEHRKGYLSSAKPCFHLSLTGKSSYPIFNDVFLYIKTDPQSKYINTVYRSTISCRSVAKDIDMNNVYSFMMHIYNLYGEIIFSKTSQGYSLIDFQNDALNEFETKGNEICYARDTFGNSIWSKSAEEQKPATKYNLYLTVKGYILQGILFIMCLLPLIYVTTKTL